MRKVRLVSTAAGVALVAAFALPTATGVAFAATSGDGNTTGSGITSVLSGNTVTAPVTVPVNICSVSVGILGAADSGCEGGSSATVTDPSGSGSDNGNTYGNGDTSVGSGNTVTAPVTAPVNVCSVSGSVGGAADSHCRGGSQATVNPGGPDRPTSGNGDTTGNGNTYGNGDTSVLSGNTVNAPVTVPVNVCGVSLALIGFADSGCQGGSSATVADTTAASGYGNGNTYGNGDTSVLSGNTVNAPVTVPVNVCGVSLAVVGAADSGCQGGSSATVTPPAHHTPPGNYPPPPHHAGPVHRTPPTHCQCGTSSGGSSSGSGGSSGSSGHSHTSPGGSVTTVTSAVMPASSSLPTTGADLLAIGAAALSAIGLGAGATVLARRRGAGAPA